MMTISKKLWKGIYWKIASFSLAFLILSIVAVGIFAPAEKPLQANGDPAPPAAGEVVINELMWAGSANSDYDEWIELKNMTDLPVDLSGCKLTKKDDADDAIMLVIPDGESISENGLYLISNYAADSVNSNLFVNPNLVNTAVGLSNTALEIKLICGQTLIDIAGNGGDPLNMAGDKVDPKKSMSRKAVITDGDSEDSWCTAVTSVNWDAETTEKGTPGAPNVCNLISGYKFNDLDGDGIWDDGEPGLSDWTIELYDSINGLINDLIDSKETAVGNLGHYEFMNLIAGIYFVQEALKNGWINTTGNPIEVDLGAGKNITGVNFGNYEEPTPPECVDEDKDGYGTGDTTSCLYSEIDCNDNNANIYPGAVEICGNGADEDCDGSDASCGDSTPAPASGGGGFVGGLAISDESIRSSEVSKVSIKITWTTSQFSTSQVIYDTEPGKFDLSAGAPNYGCAYSKEGDDSGLEKATGHSVTLTSLNPETIYYYRAVSSASPPVFGPEKSFVTLAAEETEDIKKEEKGEVKGAEAPAPTPAPVECNYLLEYIKLGADNNPVEVKKLEIFLNEFNGENLAVNGIYEQADFDAVSRFQEKYLEKVLNPWNHKGPTGYVYITTKKRINELYCKREFPLTPEQKAEIARFIGMLGALIPHAKISPVGDVPAGAPSEEPSEELSEEMREELQEQEDIGEVAGAKDETGDEVGEEDKENGAEEDEEGVVNADSGYPAYYPWAALALLLLVIAAVYYLTNIRRRSNKID